MSIFPTNHNHSISLRFYQQRALHELEKLYTQGKRRVLVPMATGLGKTVLFCGLPLAPRFKSIARRGVLVLVHRDELVSQAVAGLRAWHPGERVGVEKGPLSAVGKGCPIVVGSVQTLGREGGRRLDKLTRDGFGGIVMVDEAHHIATGNSYDRTLRAFGLGSRSSWYSSPCNASLNASHRLLVGFTATPSRSDGRSLAPFFESSITPLDLEWGVNNSFLVDIEAWSVMSATPADLFNIPLNASGDDLQQKALVAALNVNERNAAVTATLKHLKEMNERDGVGPPSTICFCASVEHAHSLANRLLLENIPAAAIDGKMDKKLRKKVLLDFGSGKLSVITNFGVLTEGFDAPHCNTIIMARPTLSQPLYMQMLGRGTRPSVGKNAGNLFNQSSDEMGMQFRKTAIASSSKPFLRLVDFVDNCGRHKVISAGSVVQLPNIETPNLLKESEGERFLFSGALMASKAAQEAGVSGSNIGTVTALHQLRELTVVAKRFRLLNTAGVHEIMELNNAQNQQWSTDFLDINQLKPGDAVQGLAVAITGIESNGSVYMESAGGVEWVWNTSFVRDVGCTERRKQRTCEGHHSDLLVPCYSSRACFVGTNMAPNARKRDVELRQLMDTLMKIDAEVNKGAKNAEKKKGGNKETVQKFTLAKQVFMKKLEEACDVMEKEASASDPKAVIARKQAIRTKLRELDNGWEELNNIYLHERNKRKSKLSTEEMNAQRQLLVDLKEEIHALKNINEDQVSALHSPTKFYKDVQPISNTSAEDNGSIYHTPRAQAGAMSDRQALRVQQIRERGKRMDQQYLTEIEKGVERLGDLAKNVNEEITMQDRMLDDLDEKLDTVHEKVGNVNVRIKDTLKTIRSTDKFLVDIMCILLLLGLIGIIYAVYKSN